MTGTADHAGVQRWHGASRAIGPGLLALALVLPMAAFWLTGRYGLSLQDEGFLWYGAQRVLAGELPLRDFQSYDVGRYFWSAAWMWLLGDDGIVALRTGNAVLASITVAIAVVLVGMQPSPAWRLVLAVPVFAALMVPEFKVADAFAAMLMIAGIARALGHSDWRRWAHLGACLGLAAAIGINHALYGVIAVALALGLQLLRGRGFPAGAAMPAFVCGGLAAYSPVIACHLFATGFTEAFIDSIRLLFETGTTNLPLPLPRPHALLQPTGQGWGSALRESLLALAALAGGGFLLLALRRVWTGGVPVHRGDAVFTAAVLVAVPYAHYVLSRFDVVHIAVSALPVVVAAWTWPGKQRAPASNAVLAAAVIVCMLLVVPEQRTWPALRDRPVERVQVLGDTLAIDVHTAAVLAMVHRFADAHAPDGRSFFVAPYWPGAYAAERRRSPTWEIYALFPASEARQRREIARLRSADIGFAVISEQRVDGRSDLGFERTHPLIASYLARCLNPLPPDGAGVVQRVRVHVAGGAGTQGMSECLANR